MAAMVEGEHEADKTNSTATPVTEAESAAAPSCDMAPVVFVDDDALVIAEIAAGAAHSAALDQNGRLYTWGWGECG